MKLLRGGIQLEVTLNELGRADLTYQCNTFQQIMHRAGRSRSCPNVPMLKLLNQTRFDELHTEHLHGNRSLQCHHCIGVGCDFLQAINAKLQPFSVSGITQDMIDRMRLFKGNNFIPTHHLNLEPSVLGNPN